MSFGFLILLMCLLGGLAVWRINLAAASAREVSTKRAPEVQAAHNVDVAAWQTLHDIPIYALTGEAQYLRNGRRELAKLKDELKAAEDLSTKFPELVALEKGELEARHKTAEFEAIVDQVEAEYKNLAVQEAALDVSAKAFMQHCLALRISQQQQVNAELDAKAEPARIKERILKIGLVEELVDRGNLIRITNFKAQAAGDMDALREVLKDASALDNATARLTPLLHQQADLDQLAKVREAAEGYKVAIEKVLKGRLAISEKSKNMLATAEVVTAKASEVASGGMQAIEKAATEVVSTLSLTSGILLAGLAIALMVAVLVAWLSTRAITGPIREGVNALATTASQISATVSQLASNASETAAAVAETTATVDEVRQTAQVAADRAKTVADNAQGAARAADTGRKATEQTVHGLSLIRDQMSSISESITRLNEQSQAVGDIVTTVADLAEQSNLLAVNASIEAAKAGDMGKGFAVVAQEIRNLAEQSKDSTRQVRTILTEVQKATSKAVLAAEQGSKSVADGGKQADETGQTIGLLTASVQEATRAAVQIAASSQQQLVGMEQVGHAMKNIKQATGQNAEGARQLAIAAHSLQEVGARLKALVDAGGDSKLATPNQHE